MAVQRHIIHVCTLRIIHAARYYNLDLYLYAATRSQTGSVISRAYVFSVFVWGPKFSTILCEYQHKRRLIDSVSVKHGFFGSRNFFSILIGTKVLRVFFLAMHCHLYQRILLPPPLSLEQR